MSEKIDVVAKLVCSVDLGSANNQNFLCDKLVKGDGHGGYNFECIAADIHFVDIE